MMKKSGIRIVAFLLAMLMVVSSMGSASLTAYAQGIASNVESVLEEQSTEESSTEEATTEEATSEEVTTEEATIVEITTEEVTTEEETTEETTIEEVTTVEETTAVEEFSDVVLGDIVTEESDLAYTGDYSEYSLGIYADYMAREGMEFNDANLIAIAEYWVAQNKVFNVVNITYPNVPDVISKEVWNAMVKLLDDNNAGIHFHFTDEFGDFGYSWEFEECTETTSDIALDVEWTVKGEKAGVDISFANVVFPASSVDVSISVGTEYESYTDFCKAFKEGDYTVLYDASGKYVFDIQLDSDISEDIECSFSIYDVQKLKKGANYTVNRKNYTGYLEQASDGIISLWIYADEWETEEELVEMIQENAGQGVHKIWIYENVSGNSRTVSTDVINAATEILADMPEEITWDSSAIMLLSNYEGLDVLIYDPVGTVEGESVEFSMEISVSGNEAQVKKNTPAINADSVVLRQYFNEESVQDPFREIFPLSEDEESKQLYVGDRNLHAIYFNTDLKIHFH